MDTSVANDMIEQLTEGTLSDAVLLARVHDLLNSPGGLDTLQKIWPKDQLPVVGAYFCLRKLGHGASGVVYKALRADPEPHIIALKLLRFVAEDERERFVEREIEILKLLDCPFVAKYLDSGSIGGTHYLAMELVEGMPLDEYLARCVESLDQKLAVFQRVCTVVAGLHAQGVIHRDLKPRHILVDPAGQPHLVDFGLSAARSDDWATEIRRTQTQLGRIMGTLMYMSPEQAWGGLIKTGYPADIWALGVMLYEIATNGDYPYDLEPLEGTTAGDSLLRRIQNEPPKRPRIRSAELEPALTTLISRCLVHEADRRLQSAAQLAADLERCRAKRSITTKPLPIRYRLQRIATGLAVRWRFALWSATVFGVVALLFVLARVSGVQWRVIGEDYSIETRKRLATAMAAPDEERFLLVGITKDSAREVVSFAASNGIAGATRDVRSWRGVHGLLMERLARASPRAVIWDFYFRSQRENDADLVKGIRALHEVDVPVVLATVGYDRQGAPDLSKNILGPLRDIVHHGLIVARDQVRRPGEFVLARHRQGRNESSLALATLGALCYPDCRSEVYWPKLKKQLYQIYRPRGQRDYRDVRDTVGLSEVYTAQESSTGAAAGDVLAIKTFQLTPLEFWEARTEDYEHLLKCSKDELAGLVSGRIVMVIDLRTSVAWARADRHSVKYDHRTVDNVPGGYLLADSIYGLLGNDYLKSEFPLFPRSFSLVALMAISGCLLGVPLAQRKFMRARLPQKILLSAVLGCVVVCTAVAVSSRSRMDVNLAMCGTAIALAAVSSLAIEIARNRHRVPRTWTQRIEDS